MKSTLQQDDDRWNGRMRFHCVKTNEGTVPYGLSRVGRTIALRTNEGTVPKPTRGLSPMAVPYGLSRVNQRGDCPL